MKLKIISDGTGYGTKVINSKTNEQIEGIQMIDWHIGIDQMVATIKLKLIDIEAEIEGEYIDQDNS